MDAMAQVLTVLSNGAVLLFVITTMLAMGLSLTVAQILAPLRRVRLVALALVRRHRGHRTERGPRDNAATPRLSRGHKERECHASSRGVSKQARAETHRV
jgi:hypothetical protein